MADAFPLCATLDVCPDVMGRSVISLDRGNHLESRTAPVLRLVWLVIKLHVAV